MTTQMQKTICLPPEQTAEIDAWLHDAVLPVARAMEADPARAIPIDDVFDGLRRLHEERRKVGI